jgi:hypothetical protein
MMALGLTEDAILPGVAQVVGFSEWHFCYSFVMDATSEKKCGGIGDVKEVMGRRLFPTSGPRLQRFMCRVPRLYEET